MCSRWIFISAYLKVDPFVSMFCSEHVAALLHVPFRTCVVTSFVGIMPAFFCICSHWCLFERDDSVH